ncbi:pyrroline-5-carboxylate reductase family protein [Litchfieldia alkalitelluris]|uniref:pyrroline-5-carboxylate reductase family protein n=1 Tax=Litchfieldia alkalitelluris TaxID=304268 RepID=UPI000997D82F|nr:pyrroline-5-carboxylate reductase [Litchfieldia alkalitelluris]
MNEKRIHFIGGGQMAEAIIRALITNNKVSTKELSVSEINEVRCQYIRETYGVKSQLETETGLSKADLIIVAIRPQDDLNSVGKLIRDFSISGAVIVSIVAGVTLQQLALAIGDQYPIVRVIPNTLTDTGKGYSGVSLNEHATKDQVHDFLTGFGKVFYLDETLIDVFTGFGVAGPNYVYYFIESLADAGVLAGLSRELAWEVALENVTGSVMMLRNSGRHPRQLLDINNSAGGVGIHALHELNQSDFAAGLQRSVLAAVKRTKELGEGV